MVECLAGRNRKLTKFIGVNLRYGCRSGWEFKRHLGKFDPSELSCKDAPPSLSPEEPAPILAVDLRSINESLPVAGSSSPWQPVICSVLIPFLTWGLTKDELNNLNLLDAHFSKLIFWPTGNWRRRLGMCGSLHATKRKWQQTCYPFRITRHLEKLKFIWVKYHHVRVVFSLEKPPLEGVDQYFQDKSLCHIQAVNACWMNNVLKVSCLKPVWWFFQ